MIISEFEKVFGPKLGGSHRWEAFYRLTQLLIAKNAPIMIVETGTIRELDNWVGDGASTLIWDWLIGQVGGSGYSVDIDENAVRLARSVCSKIQVVCEDSLTFLRKFDRPAEIDLLYLDSYDFAGPLSPLHHVAELGAIYERLKPGCVIAVDDCHTPEVGKQTLVKAFFDISGIRPFGESYITAWQKP